MDRSPYGAQGLELINDIYLPFGFITVGQDMRGSGASEGNFTIWHSDADDSEDTGNWLVQQPWSNGKIFTFGAAADGLAAFTTPMNSPEWLKAQYFIWTSSVGYEIIYPNGAGPRELWSNLESCLEWCDRIERSSQSLAKR
jgi:predicted acyl esterase